MEPEEAPTRQIVRFSLLRSYHLADVFTLANAFAGVASILAMMSYLLTPAPWRVNLALGL